MYFNCAVEMDNDTRNQVTFERRGRGTKFLGKKTAVRSKNWFWFLENGRRRKATGEGAQKSTKRACKSTTTRNDAGPKSRAEGGGDSAYEGGNSTGELMSLIKSRKKKGFGSSGGKRSC